MKATQRRAALVAGLGLLLMAVLAGYANLGIIEKAASVTPAHLQVAAALMGVVALLDVLVAVTVLMVFDREGPTSARLSAGLRILYAFALGVAVFRLTTNTGDNAARAAAFHHLFDPALGVFGLHLMVLAAVLARTAWTTVVFRRVLAALVFLAGAGYTVDAAAPLLGHATHLGTVTFVGELVLMGWLLRLGFRRSDRPVASKRQTV